MSAPERDIYGMISVFSAYHQGIVLTVILKVVLALAPNCLSMRITDSRPIQMEDCTIEMRQNLLYVFIIITAVCMRKPA